MNILLIGNGFDLAHGLPTTYINFIDFAVCFLHGNLEERFNDSTKGWPQTRADVTFAAIKNVHPTPAMKDYLGCLNFHVSDYDENEFASSLALEYHRLLANNIWLKHFAYDVLDMGDDSPVHSEADRWIDFENEIFKVIFACDKFRRSGFSKDAISDWHESVGECISGFTDNSLPKKFDGLMNKLLTDLNRLSRALEIYISDFVNKIPASGLEYIRYLQIDHLLSFNYSNTFQRLYAPIEDVDYVHGIGHLGRTDEEFKRELKYQSSDDVEKESLLSELEASYREDNNFNHIVLGIDEYLPDTEQRKDTYFLRFKKVFQRIYKKTGCNYLKWLDDIEDHFVGKAPLSSNLYIIGHSMDVTDKDILNRLITNKAIKTKIYYHSDEAYASQVENLLKIIGEDTLTDYVYGSKPKLEFVRMPK